ncbi:DUF3592 domain-containing protein [Massilia sp. Se16.2.3]|uniref:DUF3592 domain-containing protein n=1 Tax=unclassified Massilia TaxID=2609279 RepID=UPI0035A6468F
MWNWAVDRGYAPPWLWKAAPLILLIVVSFSLPTLLEQGYRPFMEMGSVQGRLSHVDITKCNSYKGQTSWTPLVSYEYTLPSGKYTGVRFSIERVCASRERLEQDMRHLEPGQPITVFYNKSHPRFAMLKKPGSLLSMYLYQSLLGLGAILILWNSIRLTRERALP